MQAELDRGSILNLPRSSVFQESSYDDQCSRRSSRLRAAQRGPAKTVTEYIESPRHMTTTSTTTTTTTTTTTSTATTSATTATTATTTTTTPTTTMTITKTITTTQQ